MKILIIGVSGFIGEFLFKKMSRSHDVYGISRTNVGLKKCFTLDINDVVNSKVFFNEQKFDVIINLASKMATSNNIKDFSLIEDNLLMTKNLINILEGGKTSYLINFSSSAVYPNISGLFDENSKVDTSVNSDCLYGLSKFNNEILFNYFLKDIKVVNLRVGYVYGDNMDKSRIHKIFENELKEKNKITIWGNGKRSFPQISLTSLNSIVIDLIIKQPYGIYNVADENISLLNLAKRYIRLYGNSESEIFLLDKIKNNYAFKMKTDKINKV